MLLERSYAQRQRQQSIVNFGVVATAQALDDQGSNLLELRCECGRADCSNLVAISRNEYAQAMTSHTYLLVSREHLPDPSKTLAENDRYAIVASSPGATDRCHTPIA